MTLEEGKKIIKPLLSEKRYRHSVNVAAEALRLAKKYGADPKKAEIAGILHDCMKDMPADKQLKSIEQFGIILTDVEKAGKKLWHAILGAAYIEKVLKLEDPEILTAVRYHTTGRSGMSLLEKVVFVADFTSADRDYPGVDRMRKKADSDLDSAILEGTAFTIQELTEGGWAIHPDTVALYNETVLKKQKEKL